MVHHLFSRRRQIDLLHPTKCQDCGRRTNPTEEEANQPAGSPLTGNNWVERPSKAFALTSSRAYRLECRAIHARYKDLDARQT